MKTAETGYLMPTVVLASHTTGLGVIRALGRKGVPIVVFYYDRNDMGYVSKYVGEKFLVPHPEHHEEEFIRQLAAYGAQHGRSLLVPTDDATLAIVSKHKPLLSRHYEVACTGWEITEKYLDKKHAYKLAESCGVACPQTYLPESLRELAHAEHLLGFPCLLKPCQSHQYFECFHKKLTLVNDRRMLYAAFCEAREAGTDIMLQEYIPGDDTGNINYNSYCWDDEPLVEFTAGKIRLFPTEFGVPCVVKSDSHPGVVAAGRKILKALGYHGYSCMEFKLDARDGTYKFLEVNGRHNRSTLLAVHCGLNFPWIEYQHLLHGELPAQQEYRHGVYWIDEVKDLLHLVMHAGVDVSRMLRHMEPYRQEHVYSVFAQDDLQPICKRLKDIVLMGLKTVCHKIPEKKLRLNNDCVTKPLSIG